MGTPDEDVDFARGGDDGENTDTSIQNINYAGTSEFNDPAVFNRVFRNLRLRTETLRAELRGLKYLADYDRGLVLWSPGSVALTTSSPGFRLVTSDDLVLSPGLVPGYASGGRAHGARLFIGSNAYAGTLGVNDLSVVASSDTTGQRGYADGTDMSDVGTLSVGGNNITFELVGENRAGGTGSIQAVVTGSPRRHIRVSYGTQSPGVTLAQLINAINNDATLFGTESGFGLRHMIFASTTSSGATTSLPAVSPTKLAGGYDAETYVVTAAQMAAFFSASSENVLREGDCLAIGFPAGLVQTGTETEVMGVWQNLGGRRQSLTDAPTDRLGGSVDNMGGSSTYGNLFNTARQPELIPNAIPIGRVLSNEFVFIDGTRLVADGPAISISESHITVARITAMIAQVYSNLALTTGTTGASIVGYGGSAQWHAGTADDGTATLSLPAGTVENALDSVVTQLSSRTLNSSGSRRVGGEALTGTATSGNTALSLTQLSVRGQLALVLNGVAGLNQRVYESGHRMVTPNPLYKDFTNADSVTVSGKGGVFLQSTLGVPINLGAAASGTPEHHSLTLQPLVYNNGGNDILTAAEAGSFSTSTTLIFSGMNSSKFGFLAAKLPLVTRGSAIVPMVLAKITGLAGAAAAPDGLYVVRGFNTGTNAITFRTLDNLAPDFTGMSGTATVTFYNTLAVGNDLIQSRLRAYHYSAEKPFAVVGVPTVDAPILEVYTPNVGQTGDLQSLYLANRANWTSVRRTLGGALTRSTTQILMQADKEVLDGNESGTPVDASTSHHHNTLYSVLAHKHNGTYDKRVPTATTVPTPLVIYDLFTEGSSGGTLTPSSTTDVGAGFVKTALVLEVRAHLESPGLAGNLLRGFVLNFYGWNGAARVNYSGKVQLGFWDGDSSSHAFVWEGTALITVPLNTPSQTAGTFYVEILAPTGSDGTAALRSYFAIREVAAHVTTA